MALHRTSQPPKNAENPRLMHSAAYAPKRCGPPSMATAIRIGAGRPQRPKRRSACIPMAAPRALSSQALPRRSSPSHLPPAAAWTASAISTAPTPATAQAKRWPPATTARPAPPAPVIRAAAAMPPIALAPHVPSARSAARKVPVCLRPDTGGSRRAGRSRQRALNRVGIRSAGSPPAFRANAAPPRPAGTARAATRPNATAIGHPSRGARRCPARSPAPTNPRVAPQDRRSPHASAQLCYASGTYIGCICYEPGDCEAFEDGDACNGTLFCEAKGAPPYCKKNLRVLGSTSGWGDGGLQMCACPSYARQLRVRRQTSGLRVTHGIEVLRRRCDTYVQIARPVTGVRGPYNALS